MYYDYHFMGMHLIWWFVWLVFLVTFFGWHNPVPKRGMKKGRLNQMAITDNLEAHFPVPEND